MNVACPRCQYAIQASPQLAGQQFACPQCALLMLMPVVPPEIDEPPTVDVRPRSRHSSYSPQRSPGVSAVLSFFWPGVGQIYNGEIAKGLVMFFINVTAGAILAAMVIGSLGNDAFESAAVVAVLGLVFFVPYWVFTVYDAYHRAQALNYRGR